MEKKTLKHKLLLSVNWNSQIQQLEASISNYRIQYAGSGSQQAFSTSLDSQIASLKAQQLSKVGQDLLLLSQQIADLEQ